MLERIDRVQMAVPDMKAAAAGWVDLLGAEHDGNDRVDGLAAKRARYRLGDGWVELLEPDGAGPVADALARRGGGHLFAAGVATGDIGGVEARVRRFGCNPLLEGGRIYLDGADTGGHGLRIVVSADEKLAPVGVIDRFYEVTNLVRDCEPSLVRLAELFDLNREDFVPIRSKEFGYDGTLTLFDADRLDRIEVIRPSEPDKTMGRFFERHGETLYMAFAEADGLAGIEEKARALGAKVTAMGGSGGDNEQGPDTLFVHPPALGGMMLGLSRRGYAWTWSGRPERATVGA